MDKNLMYRGRLTQPVTASGQTIWTIAHPRNGDKVLGSILPSGTVTTTNVAVPVGTYNSQTGQFTLSRTTDGFNQLRFPVKPNTVYRFKLEVLPGSLVPSWRAASFTADIGGSDTGLISTGAGTTEMFLELSANGNCMGTITLLSETNYMVIEGQSQANRRLPVREISKNGVQAYNESTHDLSVSPWQPYNSTVTKLTTGTEIRSLSTSSFPAIRYAVSKKSLDRKGPVTVVMKVRATATGDCSMVLLNGAFSDSPIAGVYSGRVIEGPGDFSLVNSNAAQVRNLSTTTWTTLQLTLHDHNPHNVPELYFAMLPCQWTQRTQVVADRAVEVAFVQIQRGYFFQQEQARTTNYSVTPTPNWPTTMLIEWLNEWSLFAYKAYEPTEIYWEIAYRRQNGEVYILPYLNTNDMQTIAHPDVVEIEVRPGGFKPGEFDLLKEQWKTAYGF